MSLEDCKNLFKEHWTWLANNPEKNEQDWYKFEELILSITSYSFACHVVPVIDLGWSGSMRESNYRRACPICPVDWGVKPDYKQCINPESPYFKWDQEKPNLYFKYLFRRQYLSKIEKRKYYASIIANSWR